MQSDMSWMDRAACSGKDEEGGAPIFFSTEPVGNGFPDPHAAARAICAPCEVKEACLAYALAKPERYGVWGGTSPAERVVLRRSMAGVRSRKKARAG